MKVAIVPPKATPIVLNPVKWNSTHSMEKAAIPKIAMVILSIHIVDDDLLVEGPYWVWIEKWSKNVFKSIIGK